MDSRLRMLARGANMPDKPTGKRTPVLLAADEYYSVLAVVRGLRAAGYAPYLAVSEPGTYAARSRATAGIFRVPNPDFDRDGFACELACAAGRISAAAVLPSAESHLLALAGREAEFVKTVLGVPSRERVERATDKRMLPDLAASAGLATPPTVKVERGGGRALGEFGFPAIIKPPRSWARDPDDGTLSGPVRYVYSVEQAEEALEDLPGGGLLQPYIFGSLTSVSGVGWEGGLVCAMHQVSERIWPEPTGVSSYARTVPPDRGLERGVGRLLGEIGWSGPFQAQFIRDARGEHYLIDLNPRIYGSISLAIAAGMNLPAIWLDLLLDRRPNIGAYRVGTRFRQEEKDFRALARMFKNGERLSALRGLAPRRDTTHAVFSLRDPMPLLTSAANLSRWLKR